MFCSAEGCKTVGYATEFVVNYFIGGLSPLYLNQVGFSEETYEEMMSLALDMEDEGTAFVATACPLPR